MGEIPVIIRDRPAFLERIESLTLSWRAIQKGAANHPFDAAPAVRDQMLELFGGELGARDTLRFIEEKMAAGIWSWDLPSGDMHWSHGFFALLGIEAGSIKPSSAVLSQMVHPDDRPPSEAVGRMLNEGLPAEWEFRIIRPNGRVRWIATHSELLMDSDGRPSRSIGISFDVTKRHELLQSMEIATGQREALELAAQGIVWFANKDGRVTKVLRFDSAPGELATPGHAEHGDDILHDDEKALVNEMWSKASIAKVPCVFEHRIRQNDQSYRWARTRIVPVMSRRGALLSLIGLSSDIELEKRYSPNSARPKQLTGAQLRAARGLLAWSVKDLAERTSVSPTTIRRYEQFDGPIDSSEPATEIIEYALNQAGIEFIFPEIGKPGIRPK